MAGQSSLAGPSPSASAETTSTPAAAPQGGTTAEETAQAADQQAQERGRGRKARKAAAPKQPRIAEGFVYDKHPDTGEDVVFVRGERLPDWVKTKSAKDDAEVEHS